jgi:lysophospholipase L1-like esterase
VIEVFWGYFVFVDSKRYPVVGDDLLAKERRYIAGVTQAVSESVADSCRNTGAGVPLILFLGSSQTEGVGVKRKGEEFVSRLQKMLAGNDSLSARCINGGISSQNSGGLLNRYLNDWIDCEPSLVVINLANNDVSPEEFRTGLRRFAEVNLMRGIATLFVTEALSVERFPEGRATQHVMREVAREKHVPLVDMHSHLAACVNDGFLWWDHVHPTSFGHQLIAERLYAPIAKLLGQASVRTDSPSGL